MLKLYQLWLDDLFPKARFLDALAMVEKMGHKRQLQVARMDLINEGQPKSVHEDSLFDEPALPRTEKDSTRALTKLAPMFENATTERPKTPERGSGTVDIDNLYDATPLAARPKPAAAASLFGGGSTSLFGGDKSKDDNDVPDDDLDALMAEAEAENTTKSTQSVVMRVDDDMDDLDAWMAEAEADGSSRPTEPVAASFQKPAVQRDEFEDDLDAMAEMEGW